MNANGYPTGRNIDPKNITVDLVDTMESKYSNRSIM